MLNNFKFKNKISSNGFTLVEILVTITIVALISTITFVVLSSVRAQGRDVKRLTDKRAIIMALNMYKTDNGTWPITGNSWKCLVPSGESCWRSTHPGDSAFLVPLAPFLSNIPRPMVAAGSFGYNAYLYGTFTVAGPPYIPFPGAYLIWPQEAGMGQKCPNFTQIDAYDGYVYCYEWLGPL